MTAPALEIDGLRKTYQAGWRRKAVEAVAGIDLTIEMGESFGLIGPNGAGKSTTIKILVGAMTGTSGTLRIRGLDVSCPESRRGMGYVPESPYLSDCLTPFEILTMGIRMHGLRLDDEGKHCRRWLERFDLGHVADRQLRTFSKGMVQRTALAHALAVRPWFLVLDEPLSGLDPVGRRDVVDILSEFHRDGGTLLFTSHVLHDVERVANRYGLLHRGQLKAVSSMADLIGEKDLVMVRTRGGNPVHSMREEFPGQWIGEIPRSELWELLNATREAGHSLVEVKPTLSIETAFLRAIEAPDS